MSTYLEIDGSEGEGGGQVLRSSLALSILTGRPFKLFNIRAKRSKPGLAAQHLACVKAAAAISKGVYKGGSIGSTVLHFEPGDVVSGNYTFSIGTAGATGLVLHTVALPLALRGKDASTVTITGGTHVAHSPCFHFNQITWAGYHRKLGIEIELEMKRAGFYPRGGGEIVARISPCSQLYPLTLTAAPEITTAGGFSAVADLPESIQKNQTRRMMHRLKQGDLECHIVPESWSNGPSTVAAVILRQTAVPTCFFALGEKGKPAEAVADEAVDQALAFRDAKAPVDPHSADQIILPLTFAPLPSEFRVSEVTLHLLTNIDVIRRFVERNLVCEGNLGSPGTIRVG